MTLLAKIGGYLEMAGIRNTLVDDTVVIDGGVVIMGCREYVMVGCGNSEISEIRVDDGKFWGKLDNILSSLGVCYV